MRKRKKVDVLRIIIDCTECSASGECPHCDGFEDGCEECNYGSCPYCMGWCEEEVEDFEIVGDEVYIFLGS